MNPRISKLKSYDEDVLMLAIEDNHYGKHVPVQIGTNIIDKLIQTMTQKEFQEAGNTWKWVHTSMVL